MHATDFFVERPLLIDEDGLGRALRAAVDATGCIEEAGRKLVQMFTVDLDMLAGLRAGEGPEAPRPSRLG